MLVTHCWRVGSSCVQGMQRPLVRRRHTVFPNRDLNQPRDDSVDEDQATVTVDLQTRPRLDARRKCQSFHRPAITATQPLQPASHDHVMADDSVASPTIGASNDLEKRFSTSFAQKKTSERICMKFSRNVSSGPVNYK